MDKSDYENRMGTLINDGPYELLNKSPLPKMITQSNTTRTKISEVFGNRFLRTLIVSNPTLPKLYGLPKIHKTGNKMRPIVSNINAPCYKISKWLVNEINKIPRVDSFSVQNSFEFVENIKNVKLEEDEVMISFDVEQLFPSIPVDEAIEAMDEHLAKLNVDENKKNVYIKVAKSCMQQNFFQFRERFYYMKKGTSMGNPLSPAIAEFFMAKLENILKSRKKLPRIWLRYVDDIFSIVKKSEIQEILDLLNSLSVSINFSHEMEVDGKIPFLDLMLSRNVDGTIRIGIYHKPTSTERCITNDSFCPIQHKHAAFHSYVHRLCKLPLSIPEYKEEYGHIKRVANINGYNSDFIDRLIIKHARKIKQANMSTLFHQNKPDEVQPRKVSFAYNPKITDKLKSVFQQGNMQMVFSSQNKLKNLLGSTKDKTKDLQKSGIYSVKCGDCDEIYHGQTRRNVGVRFKEHSASFKYNKHRASALAAHVLNLGHFNVTIDNLSLVKQVNDNRRLDAYESYYIQSNENSMNADNGNVVSPLFTFV